MRPLWERLRCDGTAPITDQSAGEIMFRSLIYFDNLMGSGVKFYLSHKQERMISWTLGSFSDVGLIKTVF